LGPSELLNNDTAAYAYLEDLALRIFLVADNEDRSGEASKKTAKTFYTASIFLEALKVFGELEPEVRNEEEGGYHCSGLTSCFGEISPIQNHLSDFFFYICLDP
jgi:hypothetical protein